MSFDANPPYAPFERMEEGTVIWDFDRIRLNNGFRVGTNLNLNLYLPGRAGDVFYGSLHCLANVIERMNIKI